MISASKRLLKEFPSEAEMHTILRDLSSHGEQAAVLMGAAYLEHALELLLRARFIPLSKPDHDRMFSASHGGILGAFAAKIRVAHALDLLGPKTYADLLLIAEIRNVFAHSLHPVTFDHPLIKQDCEKLSAVLGGMRRNGDKYLPETPLGQFSETVVVIYIGIWNNVSRIAWNLQNPDKPQERILRDWIE